MSIYNYDSIQIVGKAARDAEMRYLPSGSAITSFSIPVDRSYKDKNGEMVKRTIWYTIKVFGKFAEVCQRIEKGDMLLIVGELQADWSTGAPKIYNKQDGTQGASNEVNAQTVRFLSKKKSSEVSTSNVVDDGNGNIGTLEDEFPF